MGGIELDPSLGIRYGHYSRGGNTIMLRSICSGCVPVCSSVQFYLVHFVKLINENTLLNYIIRHRVYYVIFSASDLNVQKQP